MKILICAVQFKGGSLQVVISLIKEFVNIPENDYYVVVSREVKNQLKELDFPSNFHFYDLPYPTEVRFLNLLLRRRFLSKVEKEADADCVICSSGPLYWKPKAPLLIGYNLPHMIYPESPYYDRISFWMKVSWQVKWWLHKFRYRKEAAAIFVQTDDVKQRLGKILDFDRIYTVSNTYSNVYDKPIQYPNKLPQKVSGEFRFLTLSAYYRHKNFEIIPKILHALMAKGETDVRFVVTLPEDVYLLLFEEPIREYVINVGFVPTVEGPSLYKECDAMFLPTLLECFSASYAESMVMGLPIMTSDLGFAHTVCRDAAIYFNPDNVDEIASKIMELKSSRALQMSLIEKGKNQLGQFGTAEQRAVRILELCKQLAYGE